MSEQQSKLLPVYAIGDLVRATDTIRRYDGRASIHPGGPLGKVVEVFTLKSGTQIIGIEVNDGPRIGSLVVSELLPLEKVPHPPQNTMGVIGEPS